MVILSRLVTFIKHFNRLNNHCKSLREILVFITFYSSGGDGNFVISSSLTGFTVLHGGMAPMVEDGYGIFYSINKDR